MENQAANPATARSPSSSDWLTLLGREIGDFEILREIGRGGMGTVFQARQRSLDRIVALKVLAQGLATTPMSVLRFQREAQAAARLHHSNIIPIHALGDHEGIYYYAMELVHGENLHDVIARERAERDQRPAPPPPPAPSAALALAETIPVHADDPEATVAISPGPGSPRPPGVDDSHLSGSRSESSVERAAHFETLARRMASVADALDYAHQHGVIHRDVKPHNLILGEDGRVHVFDFGLARMLEQPGVTMTGEFIGSPLYMSPEQIMGGQVRVDKRTDIYSLGASIYEWLTLSPPFPGETREQVISRIITSELKLPREHNPHIPVDLETICIKCLEKNPDRRYQSSADLRDDLLRFVDRENIRARRAGPLERGRKFILRHRVGTVVALAFVVAGVLVTALIQQARKSRGKERQIAQVHEAVKVKEEAIEEQRRENDRLREMLAFGAQKGQEIRPDLAAIPGIGSLLSPSKTSTAQLDPLNEPLFRALLGWLRQQERRTPAAQLGPVEGATQDLYLQAITSTKLAEIERLSQEYAGRNPDDVRAVKLAATVCAGKGDFECVMKHAATMIAAEPFKADGYLLAGVGKMIAANVQDAINDFSRAVDLAPDSTWPLTLRGFASRRANDLESAIRDLNTAVRLAADNALALFEKARIHTYLGDDLAAIGTLDRLLDLEPNNIEAYEFRGDRHDHSGDFAKAGDDYNRALELDKRNVAILGKLYSARVKAENAAKAVGDGTEVIGPADPRPATQEAPPPSPQETEGSSDAKQRDWLKRLVRRPHGKDPSEVRQADVACWLAAWPR